MFNVKGKYTDAVVYSDTVDESAVGQIRGICDQFYMQNSKVRIMPDYHGGNGCVIGTTMTVNDYIVPNFVGVDISCGMLVCKLPKIEINDHILSGLDTFIRNNIPSGFNNNPRRKYNTGDNFLDDLICKRNIKDNDYYLALGTLGGGNHFIELNKDSNDDVYIVIHSGSRNLGKQVADHYQNLAINDMANQYRVKHNEIVQRYKTIDDKSNIELEVSNLKERYGVPKPMRCLMDENKDNYLHDVCICQLYAHINRSIMMDQIVRKYFKLKDADVDIFETLHNYIDLKNMVLRKGAVSAQRGEKLIIPMNMRDGSLICIGKGNEDWNCSAPHGAGRLMSRTEAKSKIFMNEFKDSMKGIYTTSVGISTIDESPMAYKPMEEIIRNIGDTVEIVDRIKPIYNFKASG